MNNNKKYENVFQSELYFIHIFTFWSSCEQCVARQDVDSWQLVYQKTNVCRGHIHLWNIYLIITHSRNSINCTIIMRAFASTYFSCSGTLQLLFHSVSSPTLNFVFITSNFGFITSNFVYRLYYIVVMFLFVHLYIYVQNLYFLIFLIWTEKVTTRAGAKSVKTKFFRDVFLFSLEWSHFSWEF